MKFLGNHWIKHDTFIKLSVVFLTGILSAISLNYFLIPANIFSAGVNGVAQLVSGVLFRFLNLELNTGLLIFLLNIPIFLLGWWKLGAKSTLYSLLTVTWMSVATMLFPEMVITENPLLNAIVGGVIVGIGAGLCLKFGFTTGGFDLLSVIIAKSTGRSVGSLVFAMNLAIVFFAGLLFDWEKAIYTIISIYALSVLIDKLHTSGHRLTVFIISQKDNEAIIENVKQKIARGITVLPAYGGISKEERSVMMMVISRYELYDLHKQVYEVDELALINVLPTEELYGQFLTPEEQAKLIGELYGS